MEFKESESNPTLNKTKTKVFENHQKFATSLAISFFIKLNQFSVREKRTGNNSK